jgi:hypothetical protein
MGNVRRGRVKTFELHPHEPGSGAVILVGVRAIGPSGDCKRPGPVSCLDLPMRCSLLMSRWHNNSAARERQKSGRYSAGS